ncbi:hypothetical protein [Nitrosophilus alvini]|uniref:hypothetical protein n=1 Tax=Nitrosophilus alvini TaxID=2714855 RepID=UPI00190DA216|nr:hypothetical protein [Nitrosophilus alvini]
MRKTLLAFAALATALFASDANLNPYWFEDGEKETLNSTEVYSEYNPQTDINVYAFQEEK